MHLRRRSVKLEMSSLRILAEIPLLLATALLVLSIASSGCVSHAVRSDAKEIGHLSHDPNEDNVQFALRKYAEGVDKLKTVQDQGERDSVYEELVMWEMLMLQHTGVKRFRTDHEIVFETQKGRYVYALPRTAEASSDAQDRP